MTIDHDPVNAPRHYRSHPSGIECIEITRLLMFDLGNAVKYVWRRADKGTTVQDLDKAEFYLRDAAEDGNPAALSVPTKAKELLIQAAAAEPNAHAAAFYRGVAEENWHAAGEAHRLLRSIATAVEVP